MFAFFTIVSMVALVIVDQVTKLAATAALKGQEAIALWPGVFELKYCENTGVAFSLLENQRWLFIPISLLVAVFLTVVLFRSPLRQYKTFAITCVLIIAGGVGNLIDRIVYGYVVDFLYFRLINFPIFNFADCCVVIGAALLFVFVLFIYKEKDEAPLRTLLLGIPAKTKESTSHDGE